MDIVVVRFQKDSSPPPYLNRKDQYRMLGLVGMLMLIVISIDFTRKPENWRWFFSIAEEPAEMELKELSLDDLDFRIDEPADGSLPPDTFVVVGDDKPKIDLNQLGLDVQRIPPELLDEVQDKRVGLLRSEQDAMDRVLHRVRALTQKELNEAAVDDIGFRVVFTDAESYRGQLIQIEGTLWRLQKYPFGERDSTEDDLWQAWMFSDDSGNNPWVVFLTEKPEEIEAGEDINRQVSLAGYFFKNYGYATEQGLHIAPMLIAKSFTAQPLAPVVDQKAEDLSLYVFFFLITIVLIFGVMVWYFISSDRKFNKSHLAEIAEERHKLPDDYVSSLSGQEAKDPNKLVMPETTEQK
ncbi:hypothetical protein OAH05_01310 [bacterium]|nr:hypothetical protein [bacterium]